ncbi:MAG: thermonuclease family protein [Methylotenera sp.]|nr:thermonuclease family protein [Methylotenera sp.]
MKIHSNPILLVAFLSLLATSTAQAFTVEVRRVHDGDTIQVLSDTLPMPLANMAVRLRGIDTPELAGKCPAEKAKAKLATAYLKGLVKQGDVLTLNNPKWDKYGGRIDADVTWRDVDLAQAMIAAGYAVPYFGKGAKNDWCAP